MRQAVVRLAKLGHNRIGFFNGGTRYNHSWLREEGFRPWMVDAGLNVDPDLVPTDAVTASAGAAKDKGLSIGHDLSIVAYDGSPEGAAATPALSSFAVNIRHAGERLAHLLIRRIRGEDPRNLRELESAEFRSGGSIGPAPSFKTLDCNKGERK